MQIEQRNLMYYIGGVIDAIVRRLIVYLSTWEKSAFVLTFHIVHR